MKKNLMVSLFGLIFLGLFLFINPNVVDARSGCCSWHGGVQASGCGCNDGTPLSATCAPYYSCTAYKAAAPVVSCPEHATAIDGSCYCNQGYESSKKEFKCLTPDELCVEQVGPSKFHQWPASIGGGASCNCIEGYEWDLNSLHCLPKQVVSTPVISSEIKSENKIEKIIPEQTEQPAPVIEQKPIINDTNIFPTVSSESTWSDQLNTMPEIEIPSTPVKKDGWFKRLFSWFFN